MASHEAGPIDHERLSAYLKVLAVPNRLKLLQKLQVPHTIAEIELPPARVSRELSEERAITRQAVTDHLRALESLGLVGARERPGTPTSLEYLVNPGRLFEVVDELRRLSLIRPVGRNAPQDTTLAQGAPVPPIPAPVPPGTALVLVSGPLEGRAFALEGRGPWTVGRDEEHPVPLPYDPFVSHAHAQVERRALGHALQALPGARNGTWLNWERLEPGEERALRPGDIVGVGRSLLVFRK